MLRLFEATFRGTLLSKLALDIRRNKSEYDQPLHLRSLRRNELCNRDQWLNAGTELPWQQ